MTVTFRERDAVPAARIGRRELAGWMAIFAMMLAIRLALVGGPQYFNDSYQYLSVAENIRRHYSISTSIAHFDTERAHGRLPAPQTTFPPGYPLLISAIAWTGLSQEIVALLISCLSAITVLPLLAFAAQALGLPTSATRKCLAVWAFSAQASLYGVTLLSEAAFTATSLAAIVVLLRADADRSRHVLLAALLFGIAYWIRYAGLFYVAAFHVYALTGVSPKRAQGRRWIASLVLIDAFVGILMARNVVVGGTWTGGNTRGVQHSAEYVAHRLGVAAYELAVGSVQRHPPSSLLICALALVAGAAAVLVIGLVAPSEKPRTRPTADPRHRLLLFLCVTSYGAGMVYAGFTTHVSLGARLFLPLLPIAALGVALLSKRGHRHAATRHMSGSSISVALLALGYMGANVQSALQEPRVAEHRFVRSALSLPTSTGCPLATWIESFVPKDATLVAVEGQATGYLLRRNTVSMAGRAFTDRNWNEGEVRRAMLQFGADYLIVYPEIVRSGGIDALDSALLQRLVQRDVPEWLEPVAENPRTLIFRMRTSG